MVNTTVFIFNNVWPWETRSLYCGKKHCVKISKHLTEGKIKFREQKLKWKWQKDEQRYSTIGDIAWQIHYDRCITLHSDADISFGLFNLFNTYFYVLDDKLNRTKVKFSLLTSSEFKLFLFSTIWLNKRQISIYRIVCSQ